MSTQSPLNQPPAQCSTNWMTRLACKLQGIVEPLCERKDQPYETPAHDSLMRYRAGVLDELNKRGGYSEALMATPSTAKQWREWLDFAKLEMTNGSMLQYISLHRSLVAGKLTIANKLGLGLWKIFSVGTECSCCWGLRLIVVAAFWFSIGYLTRSFT